MQSSLDILGVISGRFWERHDEVVILICMEGEVVAESSIWFFHPTISDRGSGDAGLRFS